MKILSLLGTRPEIIRLACVLNRLSSVTDHALCYTDQNFDENLSDIFFRQLAVDEPKYHLKAASSSLGGFLGNLFPGFEDALDDYQPDAVLTLGDTNSALAALIAERRGIPVYHLEAGNRSFDVRVPEETNRRVLDHLCTFNLAYTEHARRNLLSEGLPTRRCTVIGSPLREVYETYQHAVDEDPVHQALGIKAQDYIVLSLHREENVEDAETLHHILDGVERMRDLSCAHVVVSTHPRLVRRLRGWTPPKQWIMSPPFGYFEYLALQRGARLVISDSGSVSEEAAIIGFPAISPRASMERPEALETGSVLLAGVTAASIVECGRYLLEHALEGHRPDTPAGYEIRDTSERVVRFLHSTLPVTGFWTGRTGANG
ncbi:MAG: hypothetical protein QG597_4292 [Actinomycetota bacterium]|nr:hypothetical protein [Actinomycetota bacterium]